jgi:cyclopropane-fatty-acyl-phospholipid synthase
MAAERPRAGQDARLRQLVQALQRLDVACELQAGPGPPIALRSREDPDQALRFRITLTTNNVLRRPVTELSLGRAYLEGDLDVELCGSEEAKAESAMALFGLRSELRSGMSAPQALRLASEVALARATVANRRAIGRHYTLPDEFFLSFLDGRHHFYSQCRFGDDPARTLEDAADFKLANMYHRTGLRPGRHVLDVGGGWGGLAKDASDQHIRVTTLTLSKDSKTFVEQRLATGNKDLVEVCVEDLVDHRVRARYDAVVVFGVIEHLPTYRRFCARAWDALKPGGTLYLDGSATVEKYAGSPFTRRYTWPGGHSCLAVQDLARELLFRGFTDLDVENGTADYQRTMRAWAERLEDGHEAIARQWGELAYRRFRVFLWGGAHALATNRLQAYTVVARRPRESGEGPGLLRRAGRAVASLG